MQGRKGRTRYLRVLAFITLVLLVYGGMNLYALSKIGLVFARNAASVLGLTLWGFAMVFAPLTVRYLRHRHWFRAETWLSWVAFVWMGILFLFCCLALSFDAAHVATSVSALNWPLDPPTELLWTGLPALALVGYGFLDANRIRIEHVHVNTPKLSQERITLAQISDMHLGAMLGEKFMDRVTAKLRELNPDAIVATGDIVDGRGEALHQLTRHFRMLAPPLGAYAILGNHEYFVGLDNSLHFFENAHFTMLRGEARGIGGITVVGVDDRSLGEQARQVSAELRARLHATKDNTFIVLLKHQPLVDDDIPFDLQLSGHLHGGQIFPFGFFSRLFYGVRAGMVRYEGGRLLYVNRGAGTWGPPVRLFAPPEITLITIESGTG